MAILNSFIYRKQLREEILSSSRFEEILKQLMVYCENRVFSNDDKVVESFSRMIATLTSSSEDEAQFIKNISCFDELVIVLEKLANGQ